MDYNCSPGRARCKYVKHQKSSIIYIATKSLRRLQAKNYDKILRGAD